MGTTAQRISKRDFISRVAARSGYPIRLVAEIYEVLLTELMESANRGETVVLTGFGRFYRQDHKGHKVRFGESQIDDYAVLKFSASRGINRRLGADDDPFHTRPECYGMFEDADGRVLELELEAAS